MDYKTVSLSSFLRNTFKSMNDQAINYCVLRNYECLPDDTGGSDIDILVMPEHYKIMSSILKCKANNTGGSLICSYALNDFYCFCFIWTKASKSWGVQFDIFTDATFKGLAYFQNYVILARSKMHNGIKVASYDDAMMLALLKEALSNGEVRNGYEEKARNIYCKNRKYYKDIITRYFGIRSATAWDNYFIESCNWKTLNKVSRVARHSLLRKSVVTKPYGTIVKKIKYNYFKWTRLFKPIGFTIAFIGTDGSGKSTIIEGIRPALESALHSKLKYEHMRPNLLPSIARLLGGQAHETSAPVQDPHGSKTSGFWGSLLRVCYYSLDYIFGYWLKVYPDKVKRPCIYVFDRYFYDFIIDPVRSRISLPKKLINWIQVVIPKPDLILCMGSDPEVINERKPELSLKEVIRQVNELRGFCEITPNAVWIDTGLTIEASVNQALSAIVDRMAARYND